MGRITVFSIDGCPHCDCQRAKKALQKRKIPYTEINLSSHPDKRSDMLSLSDSLTVPQIFLNDELVPDGAEGILALLEEWDKGTETSASTSLSTATSDSTTVNTYNCFPFNNGEDNLTGSSHAIYNNDNGNGNGNHTGSNMDDINTSTPPAFAVFQKEVESQPDPKDPRLEPSSAPPAVEPIPPIRNQTDLIILPAESESDGGGGVGGVVSVLDITLRLMNAVPRETMSKSAFGKTYTNVTRGDIFAKVIMEEFFLEKDAALNFGIYLQERHIIHSLGDTNRYTSTGTSTYGHANNPDPQQEIKSGHHFSDATNIWFRVQPFGNPAILNSFRVWTDRIDPDPLAIVSRLKKLMQGIQNRATLNDGSVDLVAASMDEEYAKFDEEVCELQCVNMSIMDVKTKTAFIINVYNLMIIYAQIKVGIPASTIQRKSFFTRVLFNIGGRVFSFNELENGILRSNAKAPYALFRTFGDTDDRANLALETIDPRIHFALNCGAKSCPPVKKFTSTDLEEELRIVALAFCEQDDNVRVDVTRGEVHLNTIFKWYRPDFASSVSELPAALVQFTRGDKKESLKSMLEKSKQELKIKVIFNEYDWSSNVSNNKQFDGAYLTADRHAFCCASF